MQKFVLSKKIFFLSIFLPFSCFASEQTPQPLNQRIVKYVSEMSTSQKVLGVAAIGGIAAGGVYLYRAYNKNAPKPNKKDKESQAIVSYENPPLILSKPATTSFISGFNSKDLPQLKLIFNESWEFFWNRKYSSTQEDADVIRSRFSDRIVKDSRVYIKVVRQKGKPVAFITYYPKNDGSGRIDLLAVAQKFQKNGYATALLLEAENHFQANDISSLQVFVLNTNEKALKLYDKFGFKYEGASPLIVLTHENSQKRFVLLTKTI